MSIATYNNDEEFDFDDEEDDLEPRLGPSGPSWRFTISISVLSMFLGVIAGIVGDGSAEVINGFYERSGPTRRAIANIQTDTSSLPALKPAPLQPGWFPRSEEHTSELQSRMRTSYAVFCLKKTTIKTHVSVS